MDTLIPANHITPKIVFTGVEDPENHFTAFNTHMIISRGTDVVHCKMFMVTFTGITLQWFNGLPNGHITSFDQFFELFREQFIVNQAQPLVSFDLFNVKQRQGESLKNYLNRFWAFTGSGHSQCRDSWKDHLVTR